MFGDNSEKMINECRLDKLRQAAYYMKIANKCFVYKQQIVQIKFNISTLVAQIKFPQKTFYYFQLIGITAPMSACLSAMANTN